MKKTMLFALVCAGFATSLPAVATNVPQSVAQNVSGSTDLIAQSRRFNVYYRYRGNRPWILENSYINRGNAEAVARRLERRGFRTYVELSRRINPYG